MDNRENYKESEQEIVKKANQIENKKRMRPKYPRFLVPIAMVLAVAVVLSAAFCAVPMGQNFLSSLFNKTKSTPKEVTNIVNETPESGTIVLLSNQETICGIKLSSEEDFSQDLTSDEALGVFEKVKSFGFNTVFLNCNVLLNGNTLSLSEKALNNLNLILPAAVSSGTALYLNFLLGDQVLNQDAEKLAEFFNTYAQKSEVSGITLDNLSFSYQNDVYAAYMAAGNYQGFSNYCEELTIAKLRALSYSFKKLCNNKYFGAFLNCGYDATAKAVTAKNGIDVCNVLNQNIFDLVLITGLGATDSATLPFEEMANYINTKAEKSNSRYGFLIYSSKIDNEYKNPDQLTRQLMVLNKINSGVLCFDDFSSLVNDITGAATTAIKYMQGKMNNYTPKGLTFSSPESLEFTTTNSSIAISGASDPEFSLTMDGKELTRTQDGFFSFQQDLKVGNNTFAFSHKGETKTLSITYRYVVLKSIDPSSSYSFDGDMQFIVTAVARSGSKVTASFNGSTISLTKMASGNTTDPAATDFVNFSGVFTLPKATSSVQNLGKVKITATFNGITESMQSGNISINKAPVVQNSSPNQSKTETPSSNNTSNSSTTNTGIKFLGVQPGNKTIAEVIKYQIETFDGNTYDDYSRPTNAYLCKGVTDYVNGAKIYANGMYYYKLGYGKRVYVYNSNGNCVKTYNGSLPEQKVAYSSFSASGQYTTITLDSTFNAPYNVDVLPQTYNNPATQDYNLSKVTYTYVDISLPYAASVSGSINVSSSPLFSSSTLIKNSSGYTIRLYLKKAGAFYGYTVNYESNGKMVIKFLNPKHVDNSNLAGVKIVVDAGHGGSDYGATAKNNKGETIKESELSLMLAKKVQTKLQALGATVAMTRTSESTIAQDDRVLAIRNANAHYAVSIHRNSSTSATPSAFIAYHFNAFTKTPAQYIYNETAAKNLYTVTSWSGVKWHYFYLSRISNCPVVLTENGFMSNAAELQKIIDSSFNDKCADAIVSGIVKHFNNQ